MRSGVERLAPDRCGAWTRTRRPAIPSGRSAAGPPPPACATRPATRSARRPSSQAIDGATLAAIHDPGLPGAARRGGGPRRRLARWRHLRRARLADARRAWPPAPRCGRRSRSRRRRGRGRVRGRPPARPPRGRAPGQRLLPAEQRRRRGAGAARRRHSRSAIAIVDWDVHHGDGTQAIFDADPGPAATPRPTSRRSTPAPARRARAGTGGGRHEAQPAPAAGERRRGVRRAPGSTTCCRRSRPSRPEAILVSAGYDAHVADPLAELAVTEDGLRGGGQRARRAELRGSGSAAWRSRSRAGTTSRRCGRRPRRPSAGILTGVGTAPGAADRRLYSGAFEHGGDRGAAQQVETAPDDGERRCAGGRAARRSAIGAPPRHQRPVRRRQEPGEQAVRGPRLLRASTTCRPSLLDDFLALRRDRAGPLPPGGARARHPRRRPGPGHRARRGRLAAEGAGLELIYLEASDATSSAASARRATGTRSRRAQRRAGEHRRGATAGWRGRASWRTTSIDTSGPVDRSAQGPALRARPAPGRRRRAAHRHRHLRLQVRASRSRRISSSTSAS